MSMKNRSENAIVFSDPERCLGCHGCELACAVAHSGSDLFAAAAARLTLQARNRVVSVGEVSLPVQCRQCEDAPCAFACPTGSIVQGEGRVTIREQSCLGCKVCVMVCPFGAITVKGESPCGDGRTNHGIARKCDLCHGTGLDTPACIEACPTKAIALVDLEEFRQELREARAAELIQSHSQLKRRNQP
jgi:anaerobic carbon-monoxide dehydrogenase iron sulfur subunit